METLSTCAYLLFTVTLGRCDEVSEAGEAANVGNAGTRRYLPNWNSLDTRPLPAWYDEDKFGIFMTWGLYSVVGLLDAWFPYIWQDAHATSPAQHQYAVDFMRKNFRPDFTYADFGPMFGAEFFDPVYWANLVKKAGARYIVLTTKHGDGYTNWPSKYAWNWNSVDLGPNRDLVDLLGVLAGPSIRVLYKDQQYIGSLSDIKSEAENLRQRIFDEFHSSSPLPTKKRNLRMEKVQHKARRPARKSSNKLDDLRFSSENDTNSDVPGCSYGEEFLNYGSTNRSNDVAMFLMETILLFKDTQKAPATTPATGILSSEIELERSLKDLANAWLTSKRHRLCERIELGRWCCKLQESFIALQILGTFDAYVDAMELDEFKHSTVRSLIRLARLTDNYPACSFITCNYTYLRDNLGSLETTLQEDAALGAIFKITDLNQICKEIRKYGKQNVAKPTSNPSTATQLSDAEDIEPTFEIQPPSQYIQMPHYEELVASQHYRMIIANRSSSMANSTVNPASSASGNANPAITVHSATASTSDISNMAASTSGPANGTGATASTSAPSDAIATTASTSAPSDAIAIITSTSGPSDAIATPVSATAANGTATPASVTPPAELHPKKKRRTERELLLAAILPKSYFNKIR